MTDSVAKAKKKYYPQTLSEECKYEPKKNKNGEPYWWWFGENLSDESDSESDNNSNDETESDDEKDNDKSNEKFVKSILITIKA